MANLRKYRGFYGRGGDREELEVDINGGSLFLRRFFGSSNNGNSELYVEWKFRNGEVAAISRKSFRNNMTESFFRTIGELPGIASYSHLPKDLRQVDNDWNLKDTKGKYLYIMRIGHKTVTDLTSSLGEEGVFDKNTFKKGEEGLRKIYDDADASRKINLIGRKMPCLRTVHDYRDVGLFEVVYETIEQ